jgi:Fic family protein
MAVLVAEVHPFTDVNGRISRVMMNGELSAYGETRIIISTVYRNNYLAGLRGASSNCNFASLASILRFAQRYTARVDFTSRASAEADLAGTNALREPNEADEVGVRLQLPTTDGVAGTARP